MPNKLGIGSQEDGEDCDYVVCIRATNPLALPDNLVSTCCKCGCTIQYRPHAPKTPAKICWECAIPEMDDSFGENDLRVMITPKTAEEVAAYLQKKREN